MKKKKVFVVGILVSCIMVVIAIPAYLQYRYDTHTGACDGNLRLIEHAKGVYEIKNNKKAGDSVETNKVIEYLDGGMPRCFSGGVYTLNEIGVYPSCSYHTPKHPSQPSDKPQLPISEREE